MDAIFEGRLIALCGVVGSVKTVMLRRLQHVVEEEKKITVSKPLAIEKHQAGHVHLHALVQPVHQ